MPKKAKYESDEDYSSDEDDEQSTRMESPEKLKRELKKCSLEKRILKHKIQINDLKNKLKTDSNKLNKYIVKKTNKTKTKKTKKVEYIYNPITNRMILKNETNKKRIEEQKISFLKKHSEDYLCMMFNNHL